MKVELNLKQLRLIKLGLMIANNKDSKLLRETKKIIQKAMNNYPVHEALAGIPERFLPAKIDDEDNA